MEHVDSICTSKSELIFVLYVPSEVNLVMKNFEKTQQLVSNLPVAILIEM